MVNNRTLDRPLPVLLDELDAVKRMVATAVLHALLTGPGRPPLSGRPDEVVEVSAQAASAVVTVITVTTELCGRRRTRQFRVTVSETRVPAADGGGY